VKRSLALAFVVIHICAAGVSSAQPARLDPDELARFATTAEPPEVILLTFGVGARIFEKFGHAAMCLHYRAAGTEPVCFNYGVTNFAATGDLVWGFLRGQQKFWVEPERWSSMIGFYENEDRDIWMQALPLSPEAARAVQAKLFFDVQPANRYYIYDHFFDNCTTRLRDLIDHATSGKLRAGTDVAYPATFRTMGRRGLAEMPALLALAEFVLGRQLDDTPSLWEAMFHPDVLREEVRDKLGVAPVLVYHRHGAAFATEGGSDRLQMFLVGLVFALPLVIATWRKRLEKPALIWATLFLAFWGLVIWTLVIISSIPGVRWNEAVVVFTPFDIALPLLSRPRRRTYARVRVAVLLLASLLCAVGVFQQPLWIPIVCAFMPLAALAYRSD
jgi:hypothetical protein